MTIKKRFAMVAVEKGFITGEQALVAIGDQLKSDLKGKGHMRIGTILFCLGYMTDKQVDEVLEET